MVDVVQIQAKSGRVWARIALNLQLNIVFLFSVSCFSCPLAPGLPLTLLALVYWGKPLHIHLSGGSIAREACAIEAPPFRFKEGEIRSGMGQASFRMGKGASPRRDEILGPPPAT